jgi:hypothetical protein
MLAGVRQHRLVPVRDHTGPERLKGDPMFPGGNIESRPWRAGPTVPGRESQEKIPCNSFRSEYNPRVFRHRAKIYKDLALFGIVQLCTRTGKAPGGSDPRQGKIGQWCPRATIGWVLSGGYPRVTC